MGKQPTFLWYQQGKQGDDLPLSPHTWKVGGGALISPLVVSAASSGEQNFHLYLASVWLNEVMWSRVSQHSIHQPPHSGLSREQWRDGHIGQQQGWVRECEAVLVSFLVSPTFSCFHGAQWRAELPLPAGSNKAEWGGFVRQDYLSL